MKRKKGIYVIWALVFLLCFQMHFCPSSIAFEDSQEILIKALQLQQERREEESLVLIEKILQTEPDNYQALLNAAYLHFRQGWLYTDIEKKQREHYFTVQTYARQALGIKPLEYQAKLLAVVGMAKTARYLSPGEQVRVVKDLQKELEMLMAMSKDDPRTIHILSWLNFKVGKAGALERLLATVLFGGLPENLTIKNAFALMHKAIQLRPEYLVYHYDVGLFQQRLGEFSKARPWFEKVLSMESKTAEDCIYKKWAAQRLLELDGHRVVNR